MDSQINKKHFIGKLRGKERGIVMSVLDYFLKTMNVTKAVKETAKATGTSERTVYAIKKERTQGPLRTPAKKKQKREGQQKNARKNKFDGIVQSGVRRVIHSLLFANIPPTLNVILNKVNEDDSLPQFSRTTLYRFLQDIGFQYLRRGNKGAFIETNEIITWRHKYLRQIKRFRGENKAIIYTDESWVNVGLTVTKEWKDTTVKSARQAAIEGVSSGLKPPKARGPRFALVHAGNEHGFIPNAELTFLCRKNTADAHEEMTGAIYEKWFAEQLLPNTPEGAVIVLDNARYYSRKSEPLPVTSWRIADVKQWLREKQIPFEEGMLKRELLNIVSQHKAKYDTMKIDEIAKAEGRQVLRLPPYHCELNPIELAWAQVKNYIRMHNVSFKQQDMHNLISAAYKNITVDNWTHYVNHVKKIEEDLWKADELQDDDEQFLIRLNASSSSSSIPDSDSDSDPTPSTSRLAEEGILPLSESSDSD